ncbi:MAG TPA: RecX family transcriptional regulator [Cryomorphaceae bacterium]|jgi:regulatory protein|nr:MAG: hypothetical protein ABR87_00895 [Cryomorphaceae bacterium BACL7 MAG-121220-bin83]HAB31606.1 RecX family transcriptional regulator [Cryomorphaceae bacterium]
MQAAIGRLHYFWTMPPFKREKVHDLEVARVQVQKYCAYQERCQFEVETRLRAMGIAYQAQEDLMAELISDGFLSEARFAETFVRGKHNTKGWGRVKLTYALKAKRVPGGLISQALDEISNETYQATLKNLLNKSMPWANWEEEQRAYQRMQRKGYTWDEIQNARLALTTEG